MSIRITTDIKEADAVTHFGTSFHSDDVYGAVMLGLLMDDLRLVRLSHEEFAKLSPEDLSGKIVFDVGGGKYDHHQKEGNGYHKLLAEGRKPVPYASFGLLWEDFGMELVKKRYQGYSDDFYNYMYLYVEYNLAREIDAGDNGIFPQSRGTDGSYRILSLPAIISLLNPVKNQEETQEDLDIALKFAKRTIETVFEIGRESYFKGNDTLHMYGNQELDSIAAEALREIFKDIKGYRETKHCYYTQLENVWKPNFEEYCYNIDPEHWKDVSTYLDFFITGLNYEILGKTHFYPDKYDDIVCITLGDVFKDVYKDETFEQDLKSLIRVMFRHTLERQLWKIHSKPIVDEAVKNANNHIAVFDEQVLWQDILFNNPDAKRVFFIVMPTETGLWKVKPVPSKNNPTGFRSGFPQKFYGYQDTDTHAELYLPEVMFIHPQGIVAICKSKKAALNLALMSVELMAPIKKKKGIA